MVFRANVIGERLIEDERLVGSPPLIVGDEGLIVLYGDTEGVTVVVAATDEADAERRVMATWSDAFIDELVPVVLSRRDCVGIENVGHALSRCDDPDCGIHHPEVIEVGALAAMAWYEAGRRSALFPRCDDCGKELSEEDVASTAPNLCDSCETQRHYDRAST